MTTAQGARDAATGRWAPQHGLYLKRDRTCPCGAVFVARTPLATYCGDECRIGYGRYGRSYGTVVPRVLGMTGP